MKKYSKKSDLTPILPVVGSLEIDPRFYVEEKLAMILPPNVRTPLSTMRLIQKLSAPNLGNSDVVKLFSLPSISEQSKESPTSSKPNIKSQMPTPQLLMSPKKKKSLKEHPFQ